MGPNLQIIDADVLIIGSGIAGLEAALAVSKSGRKPLLVSKSPMGKANNTILAGGAFTCATDAFSVDAHIERTIESGCRLNDEQLVAAFAERAPDKLKALREMGLAGRPHRTGFHCRTTSMVGGPDICAILIRACRKTGIRILEHLVVTDLVTEAGRCRGAIGFDKRTGKAYGMHSGAVILAAGGGGAAYLQNDNAPGATGDGYLLALEAGLELVDMEFVQFYPLAYAGAGRGHMIIPAIFGDIGKMINRHGEDLKKKYDLRETPIAIVSRDRLSQALFKELMLGNDVDGALLLDMTNADDSGLFFNEDLKMRFRKKLSYDTEPVRITPACHHTMGGIPIDTECRTGIEGLFAAGEVVGGIHGANRMGGNALCEAMVFGEAAAVSAVNHAGSVRSVDGFERMAERTLKQRLGGGKPHDLPVNGLMKRIKKILWTYVGIVRSETSLRKGIAEIDDVLSALDRLRAGSPGGLGRFFALKSAAVAGKAIAVSALARTESRGAHFREDFPAQDDDWQKHIHVRMRDGGVGVSRID